MIKGDQPWAPGQADQPSPDNASGYKFFAQAEAEFIAAVVERLIPADEHGPGAKDCGVPLFIDHQLAGPYGRAQTWYMSGPWSKGEATQGFQSRLNPAGMYRAAIKAIDTELSKRPGGKKFVELSAQDQDATLTQLEKGEMKLEGVDGSAFFKLLLMNTKEGMFSDPIYGGNKNMAAWKMIGFPGARYDYRDWVSRHGQRYDLPPVGLVGRPSWNRKT